MSACLQRFQWRSQRAKLPTLHEPGRPDRKGMGRAGRHCRPPGQRRQARRAARPARPAARARPLADVVPAGRRAGRPASWVACPASTSRSRLPHRTYLPGLGRLCRRRRPPAGTPACSLRQDKFTMRDESAKAGNMAAQFHAAVSCDGPLSRSWLKKDS
jgi:hypothetical protein